MRSSSSPRPANGTPEASYSSRCQPTPTPTSTRPPDTTSSVATALASAGARPQRRDQDRGGEPHPAGGRGDRRQQREGLEPQAVGPGREPPAVVGLDAVAHDHVVDDGHPVDADPVGQRGAAQHRGRQVGRVGAAGGREVQQRQGEGGCGGHGRSRRTPRPVSRGPASGTARRRMCRRGGRWRGTPTPRSARRPGPGRGRAGPRRPGSGTFSSGGAAVPKSHTTRYEPPASGSGPAGSMPQNGSTSGLRPSARAGNPQLGADGAGHDLGGDVGHLVVAERLVQHHLRGRASRGTGRPVMCWAYPLFSPRSHSIWASSSTSWRSTQSG